MGCYCAKADKAFLLKEAEITIQEYEESLGFSYIPVNLSISVLQKNTKKKGLSPVQLCSWLSELGISTSRLDTESDSVAKLFSQFIEKGRYSSHKLGILAVMLGEGSTERKAQILFRLHYKPTEMMTSANLDSLVTTCCEIALVQLPKLAETELTALRDVSALLKLQKYTKNLSKLQVLIKEELMKAIQVPGVKDTREKTFVQNIVGKGAALVSSQALRDYANKLGPVLLRQCSLNSRHRLAVPPVSKSRSSTPRNALRTSSIPSDSGTYLQRHSYD